MVRSTQKDDTPDFATEERAMEQGVGYGPKAESWRMTLVYYPTSFHVSEEHRWGEQIVGTEPSFLMVFHRGYTERVVDPKERIVVVQGLENTHCRVVDEVLELDEADMAPKIGGKVHVQEAVQVEIALAVRIEAVVRSVQLRKLDD